MKSKPHYKHGLTLMELLVTIMIMGIMIAVAVPVIRPPVDARSVKEAARMVSTALASARTKSIETGRSWGVQFVPVDTAGRVVTTLHFVRPITQTGEDGGVDGFGDFSASGLNMTGGGTLQLEMVGEKYEVPKGSSSFRIPTQPDPTDENDPNSFYAYRFEHYPRKSSLMPIQLPSRAIVDLGWSGDSFTEVSGGIPGGIPMPDENNQTIDPKGEPNGYPRCNLEDCDVDGKRRYPLERITFTKTGEVAHVYTAAGRADATDRIHFFIGKTGRIDTASSEPEDNHLYDGEAIWVSVDPRTGAIKSTENYPVNDGSVVTARTWADQ